MWGHGRLYLYNHFLFSSHSIPSSSLLLTFMTSSVTGETHNAFLKLSDAVSNIFYCSQRYARHKTTLGSLKMAIDSLAESTMSILFPFLLFDLLFLIVFLIVTLSRLTQF